MAIENYYFVRQNMQRNEPCITVSLPIDKLTTEQKAAAFDQEAKTPRWMSHINKGDNTVSLLIDIRNERDQSTLSYLRDKLDDNNFDLQCDRDAKELEKAASDNKLTRYVWGVGATVLAAGDAAIYHQAYKAHAEPKTMPAKIVTGGIAVAGPIGFAFMACLAHRAFKKFTISAQEATQKATARRAELKELVDQRLVISTPA